MSTDRRSSEPMPTEPIASQSSVDQGSVDEPAAADTGSLASSGSDAALVLAAVDRMQRAELHTRLSLIRLRSGLGEMALAVGRAKAKAAGTDEKQREIDTAALLDEFEHRIDAMLEIAGGKVAAKPVARETCSRVNLQQLCPNPCKPQPMHPPRRNRSPRHRPQKPSRCRPSPAWCRASRAGSSAEPAPSPRDAALAAAAAGPTVEMLRSLVQALNASIPAEPKAERASAETPAAAESAADVAPEVAQQAAATPQPVAAVAETPAPEPAQEATQQASQEINQKTRPRPPNRWCSMSWSGWTRLNPRLSRKPWLKHRPPPGQDVAPEDTVAAIVEPEIAATPAPEPQVVEAMAAAEPQPTEPAAELIVPEDVLADLSAMPYEASPEDIAASAAAADAALSHQGIAAEPATPAQASSQASAESFAAEPVPNLVRNLGSSLAAAGRRRHPRGRPARALRTDGSDAAIAAGDRHGGDLQSAQHA